MAIPWSPDRRDIIRIDCNPQAGREMRGLHPMLVLSPKAFNERTSIVIGLPMTSSESNDDNPFAVRVSGPKGIASYVWTRTTARASKASCCSRQIRWLRSTERR